MAPPTLLDLPAKVGLEILDKLPAKDVQRLRSVCKNIQEFVDVNKLKIAAVKIEREKKRLTDQVNYYVYYDDNLSFYEKLTRWFKCRGIWQCSQCEIFVANSAIYHFIDTSDMDQAGFTQWLDLISILGLTYQVRFSQPHLLQGNSQWCNDLVQIAEQGGFPLGSASIRQLVNKLIYVDDPRLQEALHLSVDEHFTAYQPSFPLTAFTTTSHSHDPFDSSDFARVAGCCRPDLLAYVFGIPQLRDRCMLAYCVHAKKMQDNLRATCTVGPGVTAVTIDPIFKAAAMEEMFLF